MVRRTLIALLISPVRTLPFHRDKLRRGKELEENKVNVFTLALFAQN